jgi:hypothetical protein
MFKDRIESQICNLKKKIERDRGRGFDVSKKEQALKVLLQKAEQKNIKTYKFV